MIDNAKTRYEALGLGRNIVKTHSKDTEHLYWI